MLTGMNGIYRVDVTIFGRPDGLAVRPVEAGESLVDAGAQPFVELAPRVAALLGRPVGEALVARRGG